MYNFYGGGETTGDVSGLKKYLTFKYFLVAVTIICLIILALIILGFKLNSFINVKGFMFMGITTLLALVLISKCYFF